VMDFWLCRMMGVKFGDFPLWRAASKRQMPQCALDEADLAGDFPASHTWNNVNIPKLCSLSVLPFLSLMPFGRALEQSLAARPSVVANLCVGCGKCVAVCKAEAISLAAAELTFNYKKCIHCYCCHEMCPVSAIEFRDGLLRKIMKFLRR